MTDALPIPAQLVLNYLRATFTITGIVPLFYTGAIAGSEFLTYAATKLYFGLIMNITNGTATPNNNFGLVTVYDEADAIFYYGTNEVINFNVTAASDRSVNLTFKLENFYCSRLVVANYSHIMFNGYRITRT